MRRPAIPLLLILALYLAVTLAYSVINPLFEAPDAHWHYFTAQYIADTGWLPFVAEGEDYDEWLSQEAAQPPLYYLLGALIIKPIDTGEPRRAVWLNPFFPQGIGNAAALANRNVAVHTPAEAWPWQGFALAAHLLRGMSVLFGLGTLLCIYGSGRLLWPDSPEKGLLATAMVAFLPQFNFVHSAISNDALITFLCSLAIWQLLQLWETAVTRPRLLLLGLTIGLAALTKNTGLLLLLYALGTLILLTLREAKIEDWRLNLQSLIINLLTVLLPVLFIAGWLWQRNWTLYGDWTATNQFIRIAGGDREYALGQIFRESGGLWLSLIAVFGWFNLRASEWIYRVWSVIVILAVVGGVRHLNDLRLKIKDWFAHQSSILSLPKKLGFSPKLTYYPTTETEFLTSRSLWLAAWPLAVFAGLVTFMLQTEAAQGRLLFPAIVPLALGLAHGLSRFRMVAGYWFWSGLALATTVYALFFVIRPAYAVPPVVGAVPGHVELIGAEMGQGLTLLGAEMETETAVPGGIIWFTLYWQSVGRQAAPPEFVLELFGREEQGELPVIAQLHSYHGRGLYPATLWPQGAIVADRVAVRLDETMAAPVWARAFVHLAGEETSVAAGAVKVAPAMWPQPAGEPLAQVGDGLMLTAVSLSHMTARPGDRIQLDVQWQVSAVPAADYTALIHLARPGQPPLATGDRPPLNGQYPTSVWAAGEVIDDAYTLIVPEDLPDGRYPIWIGLYDPETLARLPLSVGGQRQPNDVYLAGWIDVK